MVVNFLNTISKIYIHDLQLVNVLQEKFIRHTFIFHIRMAKEYARDRK